MLMPQDKRESRSTTNANLSAVHLRATNRIVTAT